MPRLDLRGVPVGSDDPGVVERLKAATMQLTAFADDPVGEARAALALDPDQPMAQALLAGTFAMSLHPAWMAKARRHLEAGLAQGRAVPRERLHLAAPPFSRQGDYSSARNWPLARHPSDVLAASRAVWPLITGSPAQRETLPLTLTEALCRAGDRSAARALARL